MRGGKHGVGKAEGARPSIAGPQTRGQGSQDRKTGVSEVDIVLAQVVADLGAEEEAYEDRVKRAEMNPTL